MENEEIKVEETTDKTTEQIAIEKLADEKAEEARIKQEENEKELAETKKRCEEMALEIMTDVANFEGKIVGDKTREAFFEAYNPLMMTTLQKLMDKGVKAGEVNYIFQLAMQVTNVLAEMTKGQVEKSMEQAGEKLFGAPLRDLEIKKIDEILKA